MNRVTTNFSIEEFRQPSGYGLPACDYPEYWKEDRLLPLCKVLEAIRFELRDMPIKVISGFRSLEWNRRHHEKSPGVALLSQHCYGRAADITVKFFDPVDVINAAVNVHNRGIARIGGLGIYSGFVHIDIRETSSIIRWKG